MLMASLFPILVTTIFAISLFSLTPSLVLARKPCHFPAIFNFGDSNSDTGGLSAAFGQAGPPNGESFFGGPAGRYSDGRLVIDFIAQSLGLPYLSAFLDSVGTNFTHGANFATAGSTIRPQNTTLQQSGFSPISLNVQYYEFHDFLVRSQVVRKRGGVYETLLPKEEDFSNALYTFDIGQNDLTAGYFSNMSTEEVKAYVPDVLNQFQTIIQYIYGQGGRYFWIHNTGPVGCLPYVMERIPVLAGQIDENGCASPFNEVAQFFNLGLKKTVEQLRKDLPLAAITYVDVYSVKYSLISQGRKHGFVQPLRTCCGHGGKYNYNKNLGCGGKISKHGKEVLVGAPCKDPSTYVNWDGVHFTQAANQYIFEHIVNGSFSDPPIPLNMACQRKGN
ncbi:GDSL-like Lipase/Acylhydrolase superfamily protein [Theobroma cacao]|uniref:GDSL-like Lipase/Acylhydrolase superfamily protein n=1 Tax=Theobroma cacao TaxID=3641 RepID=A0A061E8L5_THECC|nr:GDSL-like Lipase/Acylhydrolase superfamily protein [Theobroma cacao]